MGYKNRWGTHPVESYSDLFQNVNSGSIAPVDDVASNRDSGYSNATPMDNGKAQGSTNWMQKKIGSIKGIAGQL